MRLYILQNACLVTIIKSSFRPVIELMITLMIAFCAAQLWSGQLILALTSGKWNTPHPGTEQKRVCWGAHSARRSALPDTAVQVTVPSLRLLAPDATSRCRLPGLWKNRGQGSAGSHGRVQPAAGVSPSAPGRGKLRREVGGGRLQTGRRGYCSRERRREIHELFLRQFSSATQRLGCVFSAMQTALYIQHLSWFRDCSYQIVVQC